MKSINIFLLYVEKKAKRERKWKEYILKPHNDKEM